MNRYSTSLEAAVADFGVTGASFAYWDGSELHTAVSGLRNSVTGDPVTVDTVMHIGSITKVLNATLVMQLVDEGVLSLEDRIVEHLPGLRLRDRNALERITCEMLLNHTSGIDGDWLPEHGPDQERIVDLIDRCADLRQLFVPGTAASYCNVATVIAGYLAQKRSGTSWYTLIRRRIYGPLELHHALADVIDAPRFRCSVGDLTDPATGQMVQTTRPFLSPSFAPAGSTLMMSATDLVAFGRALLNEGLGANGARILSATGTARMMSPTATFVAPALRAGLSWMIAPGGVLTHSGVGPGVQSVLFAEPRSGRVMVLLTNCDRGSVLIPVLLDPVLESWTGIRKPAALPSTVAIDPRAYEGIYESNLQRIEVKATEGDLAMRVSLMMPLYDNSPYGSAGRDRPARILRPLGDHAFEADPALPRGPRAEVRFAQPDAGGRMRFLATGYRLLARRDAEQP